VASVVIELHDELARRLEAAGEERGVSLACAALQLLEEERMRDAGARQVEVCWLENGGPQRCRCAD
jgi:hypothetical protein